MDIRHFGKSNSKMIKFHFKYFLEGYKNITQLQHMILQIGATAQQDLSESRVKLSFGF